MNTRVFMHSVRPGVVGRNKRPPGGSRLKDAHDSGDGWVQLFYPHPIAYSAIRREA